MASGCGSRHRHDMTLRSADHTSGPPESTTTAGNTWSVEGLTARSCCGESPEDLIGPFASSIRMPRATSCGHPPSPFDPPSAACVPHSGEAGPRDNQSRERTYASSPVVADGPAPGATLLLAALKIRRTTAPMMARSSSICAVTTRRACVSARRNVTEAHRREDADGEVEGSDVVELLCEGGAGLVRHGEVDRSEQGEEQGDNYAERLHRA